jgi:translation elongation factor P/translation initiation factor 5A
MADIYINGTLRKAPVTLGQQFDINAKTLRFMLPVDAAAGVSLSSMSLSMSFTLPDESAWLSPTLPYVANSGSPYVEWTLPSGILQYKGYGFVQVVAGNGDATMVWHTERVKTYVQESVYATNPLPYVSPDWMSMLAANTNAETVAARDGYSTLLDKLKHMDDQIVPVTAFGISGTGDETVLLSTALNAIADAHKIALIPYGMTVTASYVKLENKTGFGIMGLGVIKRPDGAGEASGQTLHLKGCSDVWIPEVHLDGNGMVIGAGETDAFPLWQQALHCLKLENCNKITVGHFHSVNPVGDGVYILNSNDVTFDLLHSASDECRGRNTLSIISGRRIMIDRLLSIKTGHPAMPGPIDIEPNFSTDYVNDITINSVYMQTASVNPLALQATNGATVYGIKIGQVIIDKIRVVKSTHAAESGTTTTNIKVTAHGLTTGDIVSNTTRGGGLAQVTVVDANNFTVQAVAGQTTGDNIQFHDSAVSNCCRISASDVHIKSLFINALYNDNGIIVGGYSGAVTSRVFIGHANMRFVRKGITVGAENPTEDVKITAIMRTVGHDAVTISDAKRVTLNLDIDGCGPSRFVIYKLGDALSDSVTISGNISKRDSQGTVAIFTNASSSVYITNWTLRDLNVSGWGAGNRVNGGAFANALRKINCLGLTDGMAAPGSSNDQWSVGDEIINTAPAEAGTTPNKYITRGWICMAGGTVPTAVFLPERTLTGN